MPTVLDSVRQGARVAVVRLRSLGDCVLTTPALEILKQSRPDLEIGVAVEDRFVGVYEGNADVSAILHPTVAGIAHWRPELCINLHGGSRSLVLTAVSAARFRAGFAHFRASALYNVRIPRAQEILGVDRKVHTAEHVASAMFYLGAERRPIPRAKLFADRRPPDCKPPDYKPPDYKPPDYKPLERPYAVLHPFAALPEKTWPGPGFLEVARYLQRQHGLEPVFLAGPRDDAGPFSAFRCLAGAPLRETKSLLSGASLFIGNDSGPAHMAAAFGIPVIVLFGPSDPIVWAPWKVESEVLKSVDITSISVEQVLRAADGLRVSR